MTQHEAMQVLYTFLTQQLPEEALPAADAIFVCGNHEPAIARHAARLYLKKLAPIIIVSGGIGPRTKLPEGFASEADHFAVVLKEEGIPDAALILEKQATNTLENVRLGMAAAKEAGAVPSSVTIVSMPPLLRRAIATFKKQFPGVAAVGSAPELPFDRYLTPYRIQRMCGEVDRLRVYADKGDIAHVEIPPLVHEAYRSLKEDSS